MEKGCDLLQKKEEKLSQLEASLRDEVWPVWHSCPLLPGGGGSSGPS